jgi:hypothetical protein
LVVRLEGKSGKIKKLTINIKNPLTNVKLCGIIAAQTAKEDMQNEKKNKRFGKDLPHYINDNHCLSYNRRVRVAYSVRNPYGHTAERTAGGRFRIG